MDAVAITAILDRCAPAALAKPIAAIIRQASAFEPLLVTVPGRRPIRIQADTKTEAIAWATEAYVAGQVARIGLAQLTPDDLRSAGLTMATAFEPCTHIAGVARLLQARTEPQVATGASESTAIAQAVSSFAAQGLPQPRRSSGERSPRDTAPSNETADDDTILPSKDSPAWNVYAVRRGSSLLIYSR